MKYKTNILVQGTLSLSLLVFIGAGCNIFAPTPPPEVAPTVDMNKQDTPTDEMMVPAEKSATPTKPAEDPMMKKTETNEANTENQKQVAGSYEVYAPEKIALAEDNNVILFFHAPWCPTCIAAHKDIQANNTRIPNGVVILQTDYDTYTELKKKYGVTYQHTFVHVDAQGNLIKKWSGGNTLQSILTQIQ
ncbi:MAG: thioredoxin family protein [Candidatus Magasanikbacteria bacterium]|nr:thioredoxin family protein [Candidatus Magasanikbacteria bacterium]